MLKVGNEQGSGYFETISVSPAWLSIHPQLKGKANNSTTPISALCLSKLPTSAVSFTASSIWHLHFMDMSELLHKSILTKALSLGTVRCKIALPVSPVQWSCLGGMSDALWCCVPLDTGCSEYVLVRCRHGAQVAKYKCCRRNVP